MGLGLGLELGVGWGWDGGGFGCWGVGAVAVAWSGYGWVGRWCGFVLHDLGLNCTPAYLVVCACSAFGLSLVVERVRKCFDFSFTVYFIHLVLSWTMRVSRGLRVAVGGAEGAVRHTLGRGGLCIPAQGNAALLRGARPTHDTLLP
jgi:hypothetical protein